MIEDRATREIVARRNKHQKRVEKLRQKAQRLADIARADYLFALGLANDAPWAEHNNAVDIEEAFSRASDEAEKLIKILGGRK